MISEYGLHVHRVDFCANLSMLCEEISTNLISNKPACFPNDFGASQGLGEEAPAEVRFELSATFQDTKNSREIHVKIIMSISVQIR